MVDTTNWGKGLIFGEGVGWLTVRFSFVHVLVVDNVFGPIYLDRGLLFFAFLVFLEDPFDPVG